jgi:hypothetical protein
VDRVRPVGAGSVRVDVEGEPDPGAPGVDGRGGGVGRERCAARKQGAPAAEVSVQRQLVGTLRRWAVGAQSARQSRSSEGLTESPPPTRAEGCPQDEGPDSQTLKGAETHNHAAALEYSWIRPPRRSRRSTGPWRHTPPARLCESIGVSKPSPEGYQNADSSCRDRMVLVDQAA